jgi:hypothetical protein
MPLWFIVLLLILFFGIPGGYYGFNHYGPVGGVGPLGLIAIVLIVLWASGYWPRRP